MFISITLNEDGLTIDSNISKFPDNSERMAMILLYRSIAHIVEVLGGTFQKGDEKQKNETQEIGY